MKYKFKCYKCGWKTYFYKLVSGIICRNPKNKECDGILIPVIDDCLICGGYLTIDDLLDGDDLPEGTSICEAHENELISAQWIADGGIEQP